MRILLLGEFSGLHHNLKHGLEQNGHKVTLVSNGDGDKEIHQDISLNSKLPSILGKIHTKIMPYIIFKRLIGYDIVQMINPFVFKYVFFSKFLLKRIKKNNMKLFFLAAGSDSFYWINASKRLKYSPLKDHLKIDLNSSKHYYTSKKAFKYNKFVVSIVDGIIPMSYEYQQSYIEEGKLLNYIPFPIKTNIKRVFDNPNNKIKIYHGYLTRRMGFKGTHYILEAIDKLKDKYYKEIQFIITNDINQKEFLHNLNECDIYIDQTSGYSAGYSSLYALSLGKIVLGGSEKESLDLLGIKKSPIINILPDSKQIFKEMDNLLQDKHKIKRLKQLGFNYIENNHDSEKIALKFINQWVSIN